MTLDTEVAAHCLLNLAKVSSSENDKPSGESSVGVLKSSEIKQYGNNPTSAKRPKLVRQHTATDDEMDKGNIEVMQNLGDIWMFIKYVGLLHGCCGSVVYQYIFVGYKMFLSI